MTGPAAERWAADLGSWAIPPEILEEAPESPWGCPPGLFARSAEEASSLDAEPTPSNRRAREALPAMGSVLDVGVGGGAASLPLAPPAARVTGVDQSPGMLSAFADLAEQRGVEHREVRGDWPAVADAVEPADVVVCHHVLYNVAALVPFVEALTAKARRRVVVEITENHPQASLNPLWKRFWGIDRPTRPTADDAVAVLTEMGVDADVEHWPGPDRWAGAHRGELVAFTRRRLCLPAERDPDIAAVIGETHVARRLVTLWWDGAG